MPSHQFNRRRILLVVKWLIIGTVVFFIYRSFASARNDLATHPEFSVSRIQYRYLFVSGLFYLSAMLPMAVYFHWLNRAMGQDCRLATSMTAHLIGHLGKYVPGKAMVVVLRTGLMKHEPIESAVVAMAVFIETFTMLAVGAAISAVLIVWQFPQQTNLIWLACLLFLGAVAPTWPPLLRWILRRFKQKSWSTTVAEALHGYRGRVMLMGWLLEFAALVLMACSLAAVLRALPIEHTWSLADQSPRLLASTSLSMVAGFASLIPGGLGVREVVLDQLLKQPFGQLVAFVAPIVLRLVWLMTELGVSSILYCIRLSRRSEDSRAASA